MEMTREQQIAAIEKDWAENPRWKGVERTYSAADVVRLRGSVQPANTLADRGARKLWDLVNGDAKKGYVNCLGALTAGQAMQQVKAGIEAIYLSGWQVAADNNSSLSMYPDQSLYAVNSVPTVAPCCGVKRRLFLLKKPRNLPTLSIRNIKISCWLITDHHHLTGRKIGQRDQREVPGRALSNGLQVSVHYSGWHPQHVAQHVRTRAQLRTRRRYEALR